MADPPHHGSTADGLPREPHADEPHQRPWAAAMLACAVLAALVVGFARLPRETAPLPRVARHALVIAIPDWGTTEPVNEIVYGTRGFDTFGETFLLLAAVVSVIVLARPRESRAEYLGEATAGDREQRESDPDAAESGEEGRARAAESAEEGDSDRPPREADQGPLGARDPEESESMTVVVRTAARTAAVILAVAAVYLMAWGYAPGGGFPAGAALSGVAILIYTALGYRRVRGVIRPGVLEPIEIVGAAAIIAIGTIGLIDDGAFGVNWVPLAPLQTILSGGIIQPFSAAELVEVGTGLTIAVFTLLGMTHDWTPDPDDEDAESVER